MKREKYYVNWYDCPENVQSITKSSLGDFKMSEKWAKKINKLLKLHQVVIDYLEEKERRGEL